jgi:hypothetical protein
MWQGSGRAISYHPAASDRFLGPVGLTAFDCLLLYTQEEMSVFSIDGVGWLPVPQLYPAENNLLVIHLTQVALVDRLKISDEEKNWF